MSLFVASDLSDSVAQLKARFLEKFEGVSILPSSVVEAFRLSVDPDCCVEKFARAIEKDVNLALEVLKIANSPLFSMNSPVSNLQQAAIRLGMRRCRNLIMSTCVCNMMKEVPLELEWAREVLHKHCLTTATACTLINDTFGLGFAGEEYTAGMLHDFGRVALAVTLPDEFSEFDQLDFDETEQTLVYEKSRLGTNHCEFGAWYIDSVSFPNELVEAVRWHHHPFGTCSLKHQPLISLVRAGDHFANFLQRELPISDYEVQSNNGLKELAHLQSNERLVCEFEDQIECFFDHVQKSILSNEEGSTHAN